MTFGPWLGTGNAQTWQSPVSPHCRGRYEERTMGPVKPDDQHVQIVCDLCKKRCQCVSICRCGAEFHTVCTTGQPRQHIATFAGVHLHRKP